MVAPNVQDSYQLMGLKTCIQQTFGINDLQELQQVAELFDYFPTQKGEIVLQKGKKCTTMFFYPFWANSRIYRNSR